jgi:hypothetical protein
LNKETEETHMAVRQIGINSWYSSLAEQTYDSEPAAKHYDNLERMKSSPESEGSKLLASLSTEQIRSLHAEMSIQAESVQGNLDWNRVQEEFVAANPDFLANPVNAASLTAVLLERGKLTPDGTFLGTMDDLQDVYVDLAEKNVLQMRKGARLPKREDPSEAYTMPIEELKRRIMGW